MGAYYNENDRFAAAWLRELIKEGLIANGEVDDRSIEEVEAGDLKGFTQCHFFAGVGVWSYALRNAGWSDGDAVWTGSCPCQPFSKSGKGKGFDDHRNLWPAWYRLIRECKPNVCFGEQVASKAGRAWFDVVSSEMENADYAIGAANLCAAGVGAPHIRQRLFFVAHSNRFGRWGGEPSNGSRTKFTSESARLEQGVEWRNETRDNSAVIGMAHADGGIRSHGHLQRGGQYRFEQNNPTSGYWADPEWIECSDGKKRPIERTIFPLAPSTPNRLGVLRGAGNALNAEVAKIFIESFIEIR